jgi:hypothetical protein
VTSYLKVETEVKRKSVFKAKRASEREAAQMKIYCLEPLSLHPL